MKFMNSFIRNRNFFKKASNIRKTNILKVALCGAAGKIGQLVSLLLKQSPYVEELALYDVKDTYGLALELSHIDTKCIVKSYQGSDQLCNALSGSRVITIIASTQNKRENLFEANANIVSSLMFAIAEFCPRALVGIATNPLNSIVPIAENIMQTRVAKYDSKRVFGINSVDVIRANTLAADILGLRPERVVVPIVGGHSNNTIVPIFSQIKTDVQLEQKDIEKITKKLLKSCESCELIDENETPSLASSFSIARFISILAMATKTRKSIIECAYVKCNEELFNIKYCSTPLRINATGIEQNLGLPKMSDYERSLFKKACYFLQKDIELGESYCIKDECKASKINKKYIKQM